MDKKREDCYQLWSTCFSDSKRYMDFYFKEIMPKNRTLTLYEKETLTSMLHLNPYVFYLGNRKCLLHYIVGVATEPAYRKQGRMRRLMEKAFQYMEGNNEPVTYLMPADERIYLPFGFRYAYTQKRIWLHGNRLQRYKEDYHPYTVVPWNQCGSNKKREVCLFANQTIQKSFNVHVVKTQNYYNRLQKEMKAAKGELLIFFHKEKPLGVVSYMCENGALEVTESVIVKEASLKILQETYDYALADREAGDVRSFTCLEGAYINVPNSYILKVRRKPIIMMRIVNVKSFLSHLPGREGEECVITVKDEWIRGNNGTYRIKWNRNGVKVVKSEEGMGEALTIYEVFEKFQDRWMVYINEIV